MAEGDKLLIVDDRDQDRDGLRKLFQDEGYLVTAVGDSACAREILDQTFFHAIVVDLDVPPHGGLTLVRYAKEKAPQSGVVVLSSRRAFDAAVEGFRLGIVDFIVKRADALARVRDEVNRAAERIRIASDVSPLVRETKTVLEDLLRRLMDVAKRVPATASILESAPTGPVRCLLVDTDGEFAKSVSEALSDDIQIEVSPSGGSALDRAGQIKFDVIAVRDELPDLPGTMVVRQLEGQGRDIEGILFHGPGPNGRMERYQDGEAREVYRPFESAKDLASRISLLAANVRAIRLERVFLQRFREEHVDFLRKYAQLKMKLDSLA